MKRHVGSFLGPLGVGYASLWHISANSRIATTGRFAGHLWAPLAVRRGRLHGHSGPLPLPPSGGAVGDAAPAATGSAQRRHTGLSASPIVNSCDGVIAGSTLALCHRTEASQ